MEKRIIVLYTSYIEGYKSNDEFEVQEKINDKKLADVWEEYKENCSNVPFEINFEFWHGSNITFIYGKDRRYRCFNERDIEEVKEKISYLISTNQIAGLIISPMLTEQEVEKGNDFRTFTELYESFHKRVPTYYIDFSHADRGFIGWDYLENCDPFNKVIKYFRDNGYESDENPCVPSDFFHYRVGSKEIIQYTLDFSLKNQEGNRKN